MQIVQTDGNVRQRLLVNRDVDVICGYAIWFIPPLVSLNFAVQGMLCSQYGLTFTTT